jgi:hypothetical protein
VAAGGAKIEPTFVKRILKAAQIVLSDKATKRQSDKAPKLECSIRNLTQAAAWLQLSITYSLPVNFEVYRRGSSPAGRSGERTKK